MAELIQSLTKPLILPVGFGVSDPQLYKPGRVAWTPLDLGTALKAWWNADDHGTANMIDDGAGLISAWKDRVSGVNPTAATTQRPTWASNSFNFAYAGVTSNGTTNRLLTSTFSALPTGSTGGEIWVLCNSVTSVDGSFMVHYGGVGATSRQMQHDSGPRLKIGDGTTNLTVTTPSTMSGNVIAQGAWSGTTESTRLNGNVTTPASITIASLNTPSTGALSLFSYNNGAALWGAYTFRHVLVTTILSVANREKMEGYLGWDAGLVGGPLPAGHVYKSVRP